jgi:hypothetical protein
MNAEGNRNANDHLKKFFQWLTRRAFQDLQIRDREVSDYLSEMLARFARTERLYGIRDAQGKPLESVVDMLLELEQFRSDIQRERDLFQQMADYTLFMVGIFREYVERQGFVNFYLTEGQRSYRRVWEVEQELFRPTTRLFERLWRSFEFNAGALHYMRKAFFRESEGDDPFDSWRRRVLMLTG